ncbi:GSCOCG00012564001-RA-CDS [Cotesia congregata]|nr:GSCOCG00012564001-RA-CDS [Cotesia congregata]
MMDQKLSFREHLESACIKTNKTVSSLSRILINTMGPRTKKRRVLLEELIQSYSVERNYRQIF